MEVYTLAKKALKIKEYLEENKSKKMSTVANDALLKIFGDEDTYNRFVLVNFNKMIDRTFCATRKDGLYVSIETALRNFSGDYKDFTECHNSYKLGYNVVSDAYDTFFRLELEAFCCGVQGTKGYFPKKSYNSKYSDYFSIVYTPKIITPNTNHENYKILQSIGFDRKDMLPYLYMDTATISAFVQFRAMVYDKYKDNIENGMMDRVKAMKTFNFPNMNRNEYVAYALAIKDTCAFFSKFYSPDQVTFSTTKLPYSLTLLNTKVEELRKMTGIQTIGTISHFESSKFLPVLDPYRYSNHALCNAITKMVKLGGKFVPTDEYKSALKDVKYIIQPRDDVDFTNTNMKSKPNEVSNISEIEQDIQESKELQSILDTATRIIKGEYTFKQVTEMVTKTEQISDRTKHIDDIRTKAYMSKFVLESVVKDVREYRDGRKVQLPMFLEYSRFGRTEIVGNVSSIIDSNGFDNMVTSFGKTIDLLEKLNTEYLVLKVKNDELNKSVKHVEEAERELEESEKIDKRDYREPTEIYVMTDFETGDRIHGSCEKKDLNEAKFEYKEKFDEADNALQKIKALESEFATSLEKTTCEIEKLITQDGILPQDLAGAYEIIKDLNDEFTIGDSNISDID